jgi:RNA polymerase sigma-70 factor (sigma-E family)
MADEAAFNDFVVARTPALTRTAYLLTHDHQLAEDLVQTALFRAARAWERIEGPPEPYVRRILYTENVSRWRRRRHLAETLSPGYDAPAADGPDLDVRLSLEHALGLLTARQRTILVLRYYEDLTEAETARVLGIRLGSVESIHRQALGRLRVLAPDLGELIGADHD